MGLIKSDAAAPAAAALVVAGMGALLVRWLKSRAAKPTFFDMKHSNNAARIRLWRALKQGMVAQIDRKVVAYPDLKTPAFAKLNPLKKVPALVRGDGVTVFESNVILGYLEDKYGSAKPSFTPRTPEGRQLMELLIRVHDLYIASPNCCAPGFSHSQGAMYLSFKWHGKARGMALRQVVLLRPCAVLHQSHPAPVRAMRYVLPGWELSDRLCAIKAQVCVLVCPVLWLVEEVSFAHY